MYEVGQSVHYEGSAERDGVTVDVAGDFVCTETGAGYAVLTDARFVDAGASDVAAAPAPDVATVAPVADVPSVPLDAHSFRVTA